MADLRHTVSLGDSSSVDGKNLPAGHGQQHPDAGADVQRVKIACIRQRCAQSLAYRASEARAGEVKRDADRAEEHSRHGTNRKKGERTLEGNGRAAEKVQRQSESSKIQGRTSEKDVQRVRLHHKRAGRKG